MTTTPSKTALERVLGLFADVKPGEAVTVLLLTLNVFLLLVAYYIMKPVREALILAGGGAELKAYMSAGQTFLLLFFVPIYAKLVSRYPRRRVINTVTIFFAACVVIFWLLGRMQVPLLGVAFFLWIGIFNMSIVAQFWSFANDVYTEEQGKRLFAIVGFGASFGAVVGPQIPSLFIEAVGPYQLLLIAGGVLLLSLVFTNLVESRDRAGADETVEKSRRQTEAIGDENAYKLVFGNPYLLKIAFMILFLNWVNSTGEYILGRVVSHHAAMAVAGGQALDETTYIGKFYADFYGVVNVAGVLIQLFLVSRILKYLGVRAALLFLPCIAVAGYAMIVVTPVLSLIRWTKTGENATDYSLQNTLRGVLFLPTTREMKYKAKQAIDTIFVRAGDALSALLVFVGTELVVFDTKHFAMVNLAFCAVWMVLALAVGRNYIEMTQERSAIEAVSE